MNNEKLFSDSAVIHGIAMDLDRVINTLEYAEADPETAYKPAALIQICINQLKANLSTINQKIGHD
ncbi:hypothetical protein YQ06_003044 [Salmonella enterica subsp. diarizonae]|nr:hypothetical protein [Salmonella enterica subsp. diarizonae]EIV5155675.1 hypothetical protein [Salmonella enterica]